MPRMLARCASRPGRRGHPSGRAAPCSGIGDCRSSTWRAAGSRCAMPSGTIWLVCNGEIYNYVRAARRARGARPSIRDAQRLRSDHRPVRAYGDRLLEHLRGMFAFALWDARKQRLLAARDHLGQKPFFYVAQPQRFAFGSEIKALLALDPEPAPLESRGTRSVSGAAPHCAAAVDVPRRRASCRRDICWCSSRAARRSVRALLGPRVPAETCAGERRRSCSMSSTSRSSKSLRLHMVSDVPVGAFLSGGLDSSLLVAMLVKRLGVQGSADLHHRPAVPAVRRGSARAHRRACAIDTEHHELTIQPTLNEAAAGSRLASGRALRSAVAVRLPRRASSRASTSRW